MCLFSSNKMHEANTAMRQNRLFMHSFYLEMRCDCLFKLVRKIRKNRYVCSECTFFSCSCLVEIKKSNKHCSGKHLPLYLCVRVLKFALFMQ